MKCFYGRGSREPMYFMADDYTAEMNAVIKVFPDSISLLYQFHVLPNSSNGIQPSHRGYLYNLIKQAVCSHSHLS